MINSIAEFSRDIRYQFICVTAEPKVELGIFHQHPNLSNVEYMAVTRLSKVSLKRKIHMPHSFLFGLGLLRYRKRIRPEVVQTHRLEIGWISLILWPQIRLQQFIHNSAYNLTSSNSDSYWKYFAFFYRKFENYVFKRVDLILVFNQSEFNRISHSWMNVIRGFTWFDSETFNYSPEHKKVDFPIKILWVGRLERQKNPELIIDIAKELKNSGINFVIEILGSGSLETLMLEMIVKNDLYHVIELGGVLTPQEVSTKYKQADVLLATSRYEGSPTMLIEAMACGLPVVCTMESDPDEIVLNGVTGFKFELSNLKPVPENFQNVLNLPRHKISELMLQRSREEILRGMQKLLD